MFNKNNKDITIYILYRHGEIKNQILAYEQGKFFFTTNVTKPGILLILELESQEYGELLFLRYSMKNIIYLYKILDKMPHQNFIFYFEYVTIICKKNLVYGPIYYYSLFTGHNQKNLINNMENFLFIGNGEEDRAFMNLTLEEFISKANMVQKYFSVVYIVHVLRKFQNFIMISGILLLIFNIVFYFKLLR